MSVTPQYPNYIRTIRPRSIGQLGLGFNLMRIKITADSERLRLWNRSL